MDPFTIAAIIAALIGGVAIYENWDELKAWLKKWFNKIIDLAATTLNGIWHATKVFIDVAEDGLAEITTWLFYREDGEIQRKSETGKIKPEELPPDVLEDYNRAIKEGKKMDITAKAKKTLEQKFTK